MRQARIDIDFARADALTRDMVFRGIFAATKEAERLTIEILSQPGSGETYQRNSVTHRASAPGESPAPDTGFLRNSVESSVVPTLHGARGEIHVTADYALPLETGTERMAPRPFLSLVPALHGDDIRAKFVAFAR